VAGQARLSGRQGSVIEMAQGQLGLLEKAMPASVGTRPVEVRCSRRVASSFSSRVICWLRPR
jgi:hypothetical protein